MDKQVSNVCLFEITYFTNLSKFSLTSVYLTDLNQYRSLNRITIMDVTLCRYLKKGFLKGEV